MTRSHFFLTLVATAVLLAGVSAARLPPVALDVPGAASAVPELGGKVDFLCSACLFASAEADKRLHEPEVYAAFKHYVEDKVCSAFR